MPNRDKLIGLLNKLDDEAFSWLVLALLPKAKIFGSNAQIWPDGVGGFVDGKTIEEIRQEAKKYLGMS